VLVAQACNPSYSGGRDQEDHRFKVNPGKQFMRPYLKKSFTGGLYQGVGPEFKPQYCKNRNKNNKK
jgi:hypothetical protein